VASSGGLVAVIERRRTIAIVNGLVAAVINIVVSGSFVPV
jgi:type IV secretory pathway TrbD component